MTREEDWSDGRAEKKKGKKCSRTLAREKDSRFYEDVKYKMRIF
jgi:hypothetical protein